MSVHLVLVQIVSDYNSETCLKQICTNRIDKIRLSYYNEYSKNTVGTVFWLQCLTFVFLPYRNQTHRIFTAVTLWYNQW